MTDPVVSSYPGYATPTYDELDATQWYVRCHPWNDYAGFIRKRGLVGCTAFSARGAYVGLFPDMQAAGEALVKHAGYEVL